MRLSASRYGAVLSVPGLVIIIALVGFPVIALFVTSMLKYRAAYPVSFTGFANFEYLFRDRVFWLALRKTAIFTVGTTGLTFGGGLVLALLLSKITRGSAILRSLAMFPWAVPLVISGFMWKWMLNPNVGVFSDLLMKVGFINEPLPVFSDTTLAMVGCILADAWVRIPFMCIFILAGIDSIPGELYDAARVDGAGCINSFIYITLPLTKRMIFVGLLVTSMFSFRSIDVIFAMTRGGPAKATYVLGLYIIDQLWRRCDFGVGAAAGTIVFFLISGFVGLYVYHILRKE